MSKIWIIVLLILVIINMVLFSVYYQKNLKKIQWGCKLYSEVNWEFSKGSKEVCGADGTDYSSWYEACKLNDWFSHEACNWWDRLVR